MASSLGAPIVNPFCWEQADQGPRVYGFLQISTT